MKLTRKELQDMTSGLEQLLDLVEYDEKSEMYNAGDTHLYVEEVQRLIDLQSELYIGLMQANDKNPWARVASNNNYTYTLSCEMSEETTKEERK